MKNLIKRTHFALYILLTAGFLTSCHCLMYEKELVVNKVEKGNKEYKYSYYIEAFPVDQVLYSNEVYNVGDTIKACR
jgi:hypothetical protein